MSEERMQRTDARRYAMRSTMHMFNATPFATACRYRCREVYYSAHFRASPFHPRLRAICLEA